MNLVGIPPMPKASPLLHFLRQDSKDFFRGIVGKVYTKEILPLGESLSSNCIQISFHESVTAVKEGALDDIRCLY